MSGLPRLALVVFAVTLVGIGLYGLASHGFTGTWAPGPKGPARALLAHLCALVALGTGLGLLWRRSAAAAAGVLTLYVLAWMLAFKTAALATSTAAVEESCGESAVLAAAAWVLFVWSAPATPAGPGFVAGARGLRCARTLYGLALVAFGAAHFAYVKLTAGLIPGWLPGHDAWVYVTGAAYILAGLAVLTDVAARLAAVLATVQIGLFTALVWGPAVAGGAANADAWSEAVLSWSLTVASWVVALSYSRKGTTFIAN